MLSFQSVTKRYGNLLAVDNLTLDVAAGECFGLLGPNGAGKSTTMALAAGLRTADAGEIRIGGKPFSDADLQVRHQFGLVPQAVALYSDLTAEQNLRIFGELYGLRGRELASRLDEVLDATQLNDRRRDQVKTFSGGMQRRLNLAASLLHRPKLLLCDEPTVGVDPQSRNAIFDHLRKLNREGTTIIYSTHYMEEAERLCSRIGVIDHGKILAVGTLDVLLKQLPFEEEIAFPANPDTAPLAVQLVTQGEITTLDGVHRFRPHLGFPLSHFYSLIEKLGLPARLFTTQRPTLEALFLLLTGRTLRD